MIIDRDTAALFIPALLAGLFVTRLIFLFRSDELWVGAKAWRAVVWIVVLAALCFFSLFLPHKLHSSTKENAQSKFEESVAEVLPEALPLRLDLGSPVSVELHKYLYSVTIFEAKSQTIIYRYDEAGYEEAKEKLENQYRFRTKPLDTGYSDDLHDTLTEPFISIGNDRFRFLFPGDEEDQGWYFYKLSLLAVTNDSTHEIGFILFDDFDLDMTEDLNAFITEYCGWKHIRK